MSDGPEAVERRWAADKRDFVADSRDDVADRRDTVADERDVIAHERERLADAREGALDEWEQRLASRAVDLGLAVPGDPTAAADRAVARDARTQASEDRADALRGREEARLSRDAATADRVAKAQPTLLALAFASIAEDLYDAPTYEGVLERVAQAAVATVAGGEMASVTLRHEGAYRTVGSTHEAATAVDLAQYDAEEGPSLDALTVPLVHAAGFPDERWPILGSRPTEHGVESSLSYQLGAPGHEGEAGAGSLNIYAPEPAAFDDAAREIGLVLAVHASLAARAVGERATAESLGRDLQRALLNRDVIGQAKGILIERFKTTPDVAFEILRRSSQRLNLKLTEIARRLVETGDVDPRDMKDR